MPSLFPNREHNVQGAATAQPLVSVVSPVHNTAPYLADCIRSVLRKTTQPGSTSSSTTPARTARWQLLSRLRTRTHGIRIVNTERLLPQIVNFNFALRQISPESRYCKMVLADDWIYPDCLQQMVALAETDPEIAIVGAYRLSGDRVANRGLDCKGPEATVSVVAGRVACRCYLLDGAYVFGSQNSVLYRSDLVRIRDPFFPEVGQSGYFPDTWACFEVLERAKFGFVHQVLSYTRVDNELTMTPIRLYDFMNLMDYISIRKYGKRYLNNAEYRRRVTGLERDYYLMLALSLFKQRGSDFWRYHARGLELVGERLDWGRILRLQLPRLFNLMGNPKMALEGLWNFLRSRHSISHGESPDASIDSCDDGAAGPLTPPVVSAADGRETARTTRARLRHTSGTSCDVAREAAGR